MAHGRMAVYLCLRVINAERIRSGSDVSDAVASFQTSLKANAEADLRTGVRRSAPAPHASETWLSGPAPPAVSAAIRDAFDKIAPYDTLLTNIPAAQEAPTGDGADGEEHPREPVMTERQTFRLLGSLIGEEIWSRLRSRTWGGPTPPDAVATPSSSAAWVVPSVAGSVGSAGLSFVFAHGFEGVPQSPWVIDYGPVFNSLGEASRWLAESSGRDWAEPSETYCVLRVGDASVRGMSLQQVSDPEKPVDGESQFTPDKWSEGARRALNHRPSEEDRLFLDDDPELEPPPPVASEKDAVLKAVEDPSALSHQDLIAQAKYGLALIVPLMDILGLPDIYRPLRPDLHRLLWMIAENMHGPLYRAKARFSRQRPWQAFPAEVKPAFGHGHPFFPAHASYPSGHATFAHAYAAIFASVLDKNDPRIGKLGSAATQIGRNREHAGLHFPADSAAGKLLGQELARRMLDAQGLNARRFQGLLKELAQSIAGVDVKRQAQAGEQTASQEPPGVEAGRSVDEGKTE